MMTISSWRKARTKDTSVTYQVDFQEEKLAMEINIPNYFRCPISLDLMKDPVTLSTGITYDRESIEKWIEAGRITCPVTNQELQTFDQIPNHSIRKMIQLWCVHNGSSGIERITTPHVPVTPHEVSDICSKIGAASRRQDKKRCIELVKKMKRWARESERNKKCMIENGASFVLSSCFDTFSSSLDEENVLLLGEILSILPWLFPLGLEGENRLGSQSSLRHMAWCLRGQDLSLKQNVILVLRELFSSNQKHADTFAEIQGVDESIIRITNQQVCPKVTKAALMVIHYMISSPSNTNEKITRRLVEFGLIPLVLEMMISGEKSICEKAIVILESICSCKLGLEKALNNALTLPTCVKKILRVSSTATEFSVLILWKLLKSENGLEDLLVEEAIHFGLFQKLLVVLQMGCGEKAKEKTTELLKLLNQHRHRLGCSDSLLQFK